jgi:protein-S-isoprenylcysteine O-methyltransferase Ste14
LSLGLWLAGGVLGHDALLSPIVVVLGVMATRLAPSAARAPLAVALIVWGSITLVAVPVLGRFGALSDNPTLLDRPYQTSWLVLTGLVVAAVAATSLVRARRTDHDVARS